MSINIPKIGPKGFGISIFTLKVMKTVIILRYFISTSSDINPSYLIMIFPSVAFFIASELVTASILSFVLYFQVIFYHL